MQGISPFYGYQPRITYLGYHYRLCDNALTFADNSHQQTDVKADALQGEYCLGD